MAEPTVTVFGPALELMKSVKSPEGQMLTKPFLDVCRNVLPVIGGDSDLHVVLNLKSSRAFVENPLVL